MMNSMLDYICNHGISSNRLLIHYDKIKYKLNKHHDNNH